MPHGFEDSCTKRQGLVVRRIIENLIDGTPAKQQLGQSLPTKLQPGPAKQTRGASLSRFAVILMPPQPSDQIRQPQQNLADNNHVARRPTTPAQTAQHLHRRRRNRQALTARQGQLGGCTWLLTGTLEQSSHRLVEKTPAAKRNCPQFFP
jgi:hypothetical protein